MNNTHHKVFVPVTEATTPRDGECLVDYYWLNNTHGLLFLVRKYDSILVPQANHIDHIIGRVRRKLYPECSILKVPVIYLSSVAQYIRKHENLKVKTP